MTRHRPFQSRLLRLIVRGPVMVIVAIYFLIDDLVLAAARPLFRWLAGLGIARRAYDWLQRRSPYVTLLLFAVPFIILEPPKVFALFLIGIGKVKLGLILLLSFHLTSILVVERLFQATKATLLKIGWFAWGYGKTLALHGWAIDQLKASGIWRTVQRLGAQIRLAIRPLHALARRAVRWLRGVLKPAGVR